MSGDLRALRVAAEDYRDEIRQWQRYAVAANPAAILALLDERDALAAKVARVEALANDADRIAEMTFNGEPFPPAVTLVDLRAALRGDS